MKIYQNDSSTGKDRSTSWALEKKLLNKIKKTENEVIYWNQDNEMVFCVWDQTRVWKLRKKIEMKIKKVKLKYEKYK